MLKTAQLSASYVIAVPHWRKKFATPNVLESVMDGCYVLKKEFKK